MMSECDLSETGGSIELPPPPVLDTEEAAAAASPSSSPSSSPSNFNPPGDPALPCERANRARLGHEANPGAAVRISDSCESVLTELETDGSGEEALLLPCLSRSGGGSSASPRAGREKRSGRHGRHSSSSDKDALSSPGNGRATPNINDGVVVYRCGHH